MTGPDGAFLIAQLQCPGGGLLMIGGPFDQSSKERLRAVLPRFRDVAEQPWPNLSYAITVFVPNVDAHFEHASAAGAHILTEPRDQPWGLRDYEAVDIEGRQWNFSQTLGREDED